MRMAVTVIALVLFTACAEPTEQAKPGDTPQSAYFRDTKTGKCIELSQYLGGNKTVLMRVSSDLNCRDRK
jgi:hypothetical protein